MAAENPGARGFASGLLHLLALTSKLPRPFHRAERKVRRRKTDTLWTPNEKSLITENSGGILLNCT
jgi:hypothetical protein